VGRIQKVMANPAATPTSGLRPPVPGPERNSLYGMNDHVLELGQSVVELSRHYAIWFELVDAEKKAARETVIRDHEDFYASTALAHFIAFCATTYQIYDKRSDVKSILGAVADVNDPDLKRELEVQIQSNWAIIEKIRKLRNKVFGHRDRVLSPDKVFADAQITPEQMGQIIGYAQDQVGKLLEYHGKDTYENFKVEALRRESSAREDAARIFEVLQTHAV
jgi:AbiU2